ncbi:arginase [Penicillium angulare]|uniref:arginase n=1 Tax=Penicillium angulare TaxID=116970 RepID=UPI00253FF57B|nr:arginase [Penicillium angulare]KAJ5266603.1 arginase [Penicillium angulare]
MTLGGDHSIGAGTVTGTARAVRERFQGADLSVLWVGAHADINTPQSSMSGRIHGMPVAFASGLAKSPSKGVFDWIMKWHLINLKKLVYIGLRDVDEAEKAIIGQHCIKSFTMGDVRSHGIERIMDLALYHLGDGSPIHVSYDIDSLDPEYAPSTGFPIPGGLSLEEGIYISQRLYATKRLVAMDLVEVNPLIESPRLATTLQSAASVMKAALGMGMRYE